MLERGGKLDLVTDYTADVTDLWNQAGRNRPTFEDIEENLTQNKCYAWTSATKHLFVNDQDHPYHQVKPFDWIQATKWVANRSCGRASATG